MMIPNSFGLQARAKNCILINSLDDLSLLETIDDEILIIGAGTNVILNDYFDGTVIMVNMQEIEKVNGFISVGAGVPWADLIEYCLLNELYGIENLTHIPGSVGAAPVQNIGAYGVEISSFINNIECFNLKTKKPEMLSHNQCQFQYRDSIFKLKDFVILKVNFVFNKNFEPNLSYPALSEYLKDGSIDTSTITPRILSNSVRAIRDSKLPDPKMEPNVGSIFKNPLVKTNDFDHAFLDGHRWEQADGYTKLSAARLIELIKSELIIPDSLNFSKDHSLVLINNGGASFNEVINLLNQIQTMIFNKFKIQLEIEPEIVGL
ncbi:UDP-N-acetylmuramate dehydrogenase [SAR86 cluster bacterium SAR86E]|uniref:UDP-N-acetylenolpyruvoylglucosamine reductase n=1 Tax=SAR86 cluster bacterium SAR86E TaxID=1208365 RepID=K6FEZ7_9GAMM|nr:UDP-N-acetylmuramate dehydrogenase [SAR86 cluster bacterium SAR86E]